MSYSSIDGGAGNNSNGALTQCNKIPDRVKSSKKRPGTDARMSYPRKRAVTACQLCRMRKSKCDNQRPACGTCLSLQVNCNYQDRSTGDLSSFDPASLAILERLETAIQLLQNQAHLPSLVENLAGLQSTLSRTHVESPAARSASTFHSATIPSDAFSPTQFPRESGTTLDDALHGPGNLCSILDWPIFGGMWNTEEIMAAFFDQDEDGDTRRMSSSGRGIREEDAPSLVDYFLQHVHIKNPILDADALAAVARQVAEEGFKWDNTSCLLLVVCALANLAGPFSTLKPYEMESSLNYAPNYSAAEAYYNAARKRIGLLDNSVISIQCVFLLGVYQMYSFRPLKAWMTFNQACTIFQAYLQKRSRQEGATGMRRLEQRLYWSCLKSECEMRDEVELPPSGLAKVNHPDVFPSPPGGTPEPQTSSDTTLSPRMKRQPHLEKSWFYYLSEIACRRLKNRISSILHAGSPASWRADAVARLHRLAEELDSQVQRWAEHIPGFAESIDPSTQDELTFMLMARYFDMQELICRPFLYLAIHLDPSQQHEKTLAYAHRGLELIIQSIKQFTVKHRHHGSWLGGRQHFTICLILLAAVRSEQVAVPDDWRETLKMGLDYLHYFQEEAPDLGIARQILLDVDSSYSGR